MSYLAIGEQIVARLKDQVSDLLEVYTPSEIGDAEESSQITPCCHVVYGGDTVADDAGRGQANIVSQQWFVILAVRHSASQLNDTLELQKEAGLIIPKILSALNGWQPESSTRPLKRVAASPPVYATTCAYYPFAYAGSLITS